MALVGVALEGVASGASPPLRSIEAARGVVKRNFSGSARRAFHKSARAAVYSAHTEILTGGERMTLIDLLLLLLVAGVCGAIGQAIGGFTRGGCLVSIALGFVGALIGMWLARQAGMAELLPVRVGGQTFPVVWAIIGSALFVAVIGFISRSRR
jgi:uncharacterized membrane protein YeaQ/YmgE (transglycosylase-associated protein family)